MPVSQLPQAPFRQDRRIYPTPDSGDVLFSQVKDCSRSNIPAYGTPHPDSAKWPHHKLVFVKTVDIERDGIFEFFYAADREEQDRYNFSFGYRNIIGNVGGREFRVVTRTYLTLRSEFDPLFPAFKAPMPEVPEGTFDGINYLFFDKKQAKGEPELDSLYVIEERNYVEESFLDLKLSYGAQKPEVVPEKFRNISPTESIEYIEEGLASPPTLASDELSGTEDQLNPSVKLIKKTKRATLVLPVNLPNGQLIVNDFGGIVATRKESLVEDGTATESGYGILESSVTPLGSGQSVQVTIEAPKDAAGNVLFPTIYGAQIDSRYGVPLAFSSSIIPSNSESGGLYYGNDGSFGSVDIQPKDQWHSTRSTTYLMSLPEPQVWYGLRRENLPDVLLGIDVVGLERYVAVPTWARVPDGPLKSKTTRTFTHGPPPDGDSANSRIVYASEAFQAVIEYTSKSTSISESTSNGTSKGSSINESQSTSVNFSTSTSSGTSQSTSTGTSSSSGTSTQSGTSSSSGNSTQSGTSSSSGTSTQNGTSSSSGTSTQNGTSSSSGASTQNGTSSSSGTSTQNGTSSSSGTSTQNGTSSSFGSSAQSGTSSSFGSSTQAGYSSSQGFSAQRGTSSSKGFSTQKGNSSSKGFSTQRGTSSSKGFSTQKGYSSSDGSNYSENYTTSSGSSTDIVITNKNGADALTTNRDNTVKDKKDNSESSGFSGSDQYGESSGESTQEGTSESSGESTQEGESSSTGESTQEGESSSTGNSSQSGTSSSSGTSTQSGFSSSSGTSTQSGTSSSSGASSQSGTSSSSGNSTQNGTSSSSGTSTQNGTSSSSGASTQNGTSSSSGTSTQNGTSSSSGTSTQNGTSTSTGTSTQSGTSSSGSNSTQNGTSQSNSNSNSDTTSNNKSTSESESKNKTESETTSKSFFTLSIPKCLREEITVSLPSGETVTIPATTPTTLTGWVEVARQSEHWRHGIWVTEVIQVYV